MLIQSDRFTEGFKKYPALRDVFIKTALIWMRGRAIDDGYDPYWRVHDKLYDLSDFVNKHPGGKQWIETTRGTDITEAFESSHLGSNSKLLISKYFKAKITEPRNSPYTFEDSGFYMTLKRRVYKHLTETTSHETKLRARERVKFVQNVMLILFLALLFAAGVTQSYLVGIITGIMLTANVNCAHNFFHQRDNWRMYAFDLSLLSSFEWRITHSLSHHIFTNTIWDFELSGFEPYTDFKVYQKSKLYCLFLVANFLIFPALIFPIEGTKRFFMILLGEQALRFENLLPLSEIVFLWLAGCSFIDAFKLWLVIQITASYCFGVIGLTAAHHHTDFYHPGDGKFRYGNDWGAAQVDAVGDRYEINGNLTLELSSYGNHILHHLFPTLDHGLLDIIRPIFQETCIDFGLPKQIANVESYTQLELFCGMFKQLLRTQPRPN